MWNGLQCLSIPGLKDFLSQVQWFMKVTIATGEAEIRRIKFWGQPGQKVSETTSPIRTNSWTWWCVTVILATVGTINRRIAVHAGQGLKWDSIWKQPERKGWSHGSRGRVPVQPQCRPLPPQKKGPSGMCFNCREGLFLH
jgi:hypothetical protein